MDKMRRFFLILCKRILTSRFMFLESNSILFVNIYIPVGFDSMIDLNAVLGHGFIFGLIILYSGSPRYIFAGI